jgi:GNAT superfamily N-acetyltransferase
LREQGLDVSNLTAEEETNGDCLGRLYELMLAAREGWPDPDPDPGGPTPLPFERFQCWMEELEHPDAFFIASHRRRPVAFTSMFGIGTAVHPEYRGRGIATRLKAGSIADAARRGLRGQTTNTASPAMQRVFEKLGYRRLWSEVRLIRTMQSAATGG